MKVKVELNEITITILAELFFNSNLRKTVESIIDASFNNNNNVTFNGKSISIPKLIEHADNCTRCDFEKYMGYQSAIKPEFKTNFYLLAPDIQHTLLQLFEKLSSRGYFYGTVINVSAYTPADDSGRGALDFYMNICGTVGKKEVHDFIATLHDYDPKLKSINNSLPRQTVIISRWEHLKNRFCQPIENSLYDKMLKILGYPHITDCFEADLKDLNRILKDI